MTKQRDQRPVLFVTGHAPADRLGAFARLHELENVEFALFGGRLHHGTPRNQRNSPETEALPFPHLQLRQRDLFALIAAKRHRAVICSTGGRIALPATWSGARAAGTPLILWASLWAHPLSIAHVFSYAPLMRLYRSADAVVTYGSHVSEYVRSHGATNIHIAPQPVDNTFWGAPVDIAQVPAGWPDAGATTFIFAGRPVKEKGLAVLLSAWRSLDLPPRSAALVLVGAGSYCHPQRLIPADEESFTALDSIHGFGLANASELRNYFAHSDVLVIPSIRTRMFREPWGLVVNEAFNQGLPVIASDAVGAVAGRLVEDRRNGLVVPAGDRKALADAIGILASNRPLRERLGRQGAFDIGAYTYDAWAQGFSSALASIGRSLSQNADGTVSVS